MSVVSASSSILGVLPEDPMVCILLNLDYPNLVRFFATSKGARALREAGNNRLERAHYVQVPEIFGPAQYMWHWNAVITNEFDPNVLDIVVVREILNTYHGPSPIGRKGTKVKDLLLTAPVVPVNVTVDGKTVDFGLKKVGELAEHPKNGPAAKYKSQTTAALDEYGSVPPERACLVFVLDAVMWQGKPWTNPSSDPTEWGQVQCLNDLNKRKGFGCVLPDGLSLNTILYAHHVKTDVCCINGDPAAQKWQYARTREVVHLGGASSGGNSGRMISGGFYKRPNPDGSTTALLGVQTDMQTPCGTVIMKKFHAKPKDSAPTT